MKTLDEVIEILERQIDKTRIKILDKDLLDSVPDALHYLKHLQDYYEISANGGLLTPEPRSVEIGSGVEIKWHEPNPPLTWDELKQMEGKPVWLEDRAFIDGEEYFDSKWAIVCQVKDKFAMLSIVEGDTCFQKCNYVYDIPGTDHWQAYRKERS